MKFVTIMKMKDAALMIPPATLLQMQEASMAAIEQQKKEGKVLEMYYLPDAFKFMVILNYDNADQWAKEQINIPILRCYDVETYALASGDEYMKAMLEATKAAM